jgi:hypothetical protein
MLAGRLRPLCQKYGSGVVLQVEPNLYSGAYEWAAVNEPGHFFPDFCLCKVSESTGLRVVLGVGDLKTTEQQVDTGTLKKFFRVSRSDFLKKAKKKNLPCLFMVYHESSATNVRTQIEATKKESL